MPVAEFGGDNSDWTVKMKGSPYVGKNLYVYFISFKYFVFNGFVTLFACKLSM